MECAETISKESSDQVIAKSVGSICICGEIITRYSFLGECNKCVHLRNRKGGKSSNEWNSIKYKDGCIRCGRTDLKHQARGLCKTCYSYDYSKNNKEKVKEHSRRTYAKNKEKVTKRNRDRHNNNPEVRAKNLLRAFINKYEGNGIKALRRDSFTCVICGYNRMKRVLEIHHLDKNHSNNKIENLLTLCPTCHKEKHYGS